MRTLCIIQARTGSTRLPGKVLLPLVARPMLSWVVDRVRACRLIDEVVVATTTRGEDDAIVALGRHEGWPCSRGSEADVLDRYYQTAKTFAADCIVRVTSDCPLIDPAVTDLVVAAYRAAAPAVDYASNTRQRSYPRGLDVEAIGFDALEAAWHEDRSAATREHVTPYIYQTPGRFTLGDVVNPVDFSRHRWTVDTPEDFDLVRRVYEHFGNGEFGWRDVLALLEQRAEWIDINASVVQKQV